MKFSKTLEVLIASALVTALPGCTLRETRPVPPIDLRKSKMEEYEYKFDTERIKKDVSEMAKENTFRIQGSPEEKRVREYILSEFQSAGLKTEVFPFKVKNALIEEEGIVYAGSTNEIFPSKPVNYSPPAEDIKGELADASDFTESDYKTQDLTGKIVLLPLEKDEDINAKALLLKERGALGILAYIKGSGLSPASAVSSPGLALPVRTIAQKSGEIFSSTRKGNKSFNVRFTNKITNKDIETANIIAVKTSENPEAQNIIFTAYTDSPGDPGAASDAAGISLMAETARVLKDRKTNINIIFAVVSAAEINGEGEKELLKNLDQKTRDKNIGVIALDSVGRSIDFKILTKDKETSDYFAEMFKKAGIKNFVTATYFDEFGVYLAEGGLKTAGVFSEEDRSKNKGSDKAWTLDYPRISDTMKMIFDLLDQYIVK